MNRAISHAAVVLVTTLGLAASAQAAETDLKNRTIGYVLNNYEWAFYTTEAKTECPDGLNDGPRAQYKQLFPADGTKRNVADTVLSREAAVWFPSTDPEPFTFKEAVSKVAPGLNLDGKVGPNDFESPTGEKGIDNNFYRVFGCVGDTRPGGSIYALGPAYMRKYNYARTLIELTNVDSLKNDDDVTVTTYRGLDFVLTDAGGTSYLPHGTERVDEQWGKKFVQTMRGKIVNGVLTTDPADIVIPYTYNYYPRTHYTFRGGVLKLNLTAEGAKGLLAGYVDVWSWYRAFNGALATYTLSFGDQSSPSLYRAMMRLADGFPDAAGKNTAISAAQQVSFTQVYIKHKNPSVAANDAETRTTAQAR